MAQAGRDQIQKQLAAFLSYSTLTSQNTAVATAVTREIAVLLEEKTKIARDEAQRIQDCVAVVFEAAERMYRRESDYLAAKPSKIGIQYRKVPWHLLALDPCYDFPDATTVIPDIGETISTVLNGDAVDLRGEGTVTRRQTIAIWAARGRRGDPSVLTPNKALLPVIVTELWAEIELLIAGSGNLRPVREKWRNAQQRAGVVRQTFARAVLQTDEEEVGLTASEEVEIEAQIAQLAADGSPTDWLEQVDAALRKHHFVVAHRLARTASEENPNSADAWYWRGRASQDASRFTEAAEEFERAVELAPETARFHVSLAAALGRRARLGLDSLERSGLLRKALAHLELAHALDGEDPDPLLRAARLADELDDEHSSDYFIGLARREYPYDARVARAYLSRGFYPFVKHMRTDGSIFRLMIVNRRDLHNAGLFLRAFKATQEIHIRMPDDAEPSPRNPMAEAFFAATLREFEDTVEDARRVKWRSFPGSRLFVIFELAALICLALEVALPVGAASITSRLITMIVTAVVILVVGFLGVCLGFGPGWWHNRMVMRWLSRPED